MECLLLLFFVLGKVESDIDPMLQINFTEIGSNPLVLVRVVSICTIPF